jgi:uncharacterized protein YbjQ (UPF0145 family)
MLISNLEFMTGKKIVKHIGLVQGSSVRAKHAGRDIMSGIKNMFGGELTAYTELLHESREEATERMIQQAAAVGANAVLNVRFSTSSITAGAAEIYVYGTAVVIESDTSTGATGA